ncbi:MAG: hypothetical protein RR292_00905 [Christensenellaceae bacterium]
MGFKDLKSWQKKRLWISFLLVLIAAVVFLTATASSLYQDKFMEDEYWHETLTTPESVQQKIEAQSGNETQVMVGSYVENLKEISLKDSNFGMKVLVWFRWEGNDKLDMVNHFRIYKGTINSKEIVEDYHKDGINYQSALLDVTVSKNFWTNRFPLESHQLRMYLEAGPTVQDVVFVADTQHSSMNPSLSISGYQLLRHEVGTFAMEYNNTFGNPTLKAAPINSEFVTAMEINRNSLGLYFKCFIALFGTTAWVLIMLYISTYHRVDPLLMVPPILVGTVANIMIGANLLPDALQFGLLEHVNIWGIMTILIVAIAIININYIRNQKNDENFAKFYGRFMFWEILIITVAGHVILPLAAYMM